MRYTTSPAELLETARDDERFRQELAAQAKQDYPALIAAIEAGPEHPFAAKALDWIANLVNDCRDEIATLVAKQDFGAYSITVYGFDQLCIVCAPDYGGTGPYLSHDDAIDFAMSNWGEFLVEDSLKVFREPASRSLEAAAKTAAPSPPAPPKPKQARFRIGAHEYSRINPEKYLRYRSSFHGSDELLSSTELAHNLTSEWEDVPDAIQQQVRAAGWDDLLVQMVALSRFKQSLRVEAETSYETAISKQIVAFIDEHIAGRKDDDGKLLQAAALAWAWRGLDDPAISEDDPLYEDTMGARSRQARPRYFEALNLYAKAKESKINLR